MFNEISAETYTGTPLAAIAAAAWSCVEKMLQLVHVSSAPSAFSVSMRTAVWMAIVESVLTSTAAKVPRTHVQATSDTSARQWLVIGVLSPRLHETRHLILGELDLPAAKGGKGDVSDLVLVCGGRHDVLWLLRGIGLYEGFE